MRHRLLRLEHAAPPVLTEPLVPEYTNEQRAAWIFDLRALVKSGRADPDQIGRLELVEYIIRRACKRRDGGE